MNISNLSSQLSVSDTLPQETDGALINHMLPNEMIAHIFSSLNYYDLYKAAAVCKKWNAVKVLVAESSDYIHMNLIEDLERISDNSKSERIIKNYFFTLLRSSRVQSATQVAFLIKNSFEKSEAFVEIVLELVKQQKNQQAIEYMPLIHNACTQTIQQTYASVLKELNREEDINSVVETAQQNLDAERGKERVLVSMIGVLLEKNNSKKAKELAFQLISSLKLPNLELFVKPDVFDLIKPHYRAEKKLKPFRGTFI